MLNYISNYPRVIIPIHGDAVEYRTGLLGEVTEVNPSNCKLSFIGGASKWLPNEEVIPIGKDAKRVHLVSSSYYANSDKAPADGHHVEMRSITNPDAGYMSGIVIKADGPYPSSCIVAFPDGVLTLGAGVLELKTPSRFSNPYRYSNSKYTPTMGDVVCYRSVTLPGIVKRITEDNRLVVHMVQKGRMPTELNFLPCHLRLITPHVEPASIDVRVTDLKEDIEQDYFGELPSSGSTLFDEIHSK